MVMNRREILKASIIGLIPSSHFLARFATAGADQGGWIDVKDHLPEIDEYVMLFVYRGTWYDNGTDYGKHCICVGRYEGIHDNSYGDTLPSPRWTPFGPDSYGRDVTHWMSLPEAPAK